MSLIERLFSVFQTRVCCHMTTTFFLIIIWAYILFFRNQRFSKSPVAQNKPMPRRCSQSCNGNEVMLSYSIFITIKALGFMCRESAALKMLICRATEKIYLLHIYKTSRESLGSSTQVSNSTPAKYLHIPIQKIQC